MKLFYEVLGRDFNVSTLNAITAWEAITAKKNAGQLAGYKLWLNEDVYDKVNWTLPPVESISSLEESHARYLRQKYDYVRVMYSGGSDSYSVVEAFLRAGQKIDEILTYTLDTVYSDNPVSSDKIRVRYEWLVALYKKYNVEMPKVTNYKVSPSDLSNYYTDRYYYNHPGYCGSRAYNFNQMSELAKFFPLPNVPNVGTIFGLEKPRFIFENGHVFFANVDLVVLSGYTEDYAVEWFYLNDATPELIKAQLWSVLNFALIHHPTNVAGFIDALQSDKNYYNQWCLLLGRQSSPEQNAIALLDKSDHTYTNYRHIQGYAQEQHQSWINYQKFIGTIGNLSTEMFGERKMLPGILSKKYYLRTVA